MYYSQSNERKPERQPDWIDPDEKNAEDEWMAAESVDLLDEWLQGLVHGLVECHGIQKEALDEIIDIIENL